MKWSKKDYIEVQQEIVKQFNVQEEKIKENQKKENFNKECVDYLITRILTVLTDENIIDGVKKIEYMPTEEIHSSIHSLESLFNIKKLLDN